ncbi:cytochrome-b5 reductase, partial [Tremellales sp. Uapishka_1]
MFAQRALPTLRACSRTALKPQTRKYASAAGGGGSNLPLILAAAGVVGLMPVGLGGYVYLERNPSVQSEIAKKAHEAEAKAKSLGHDAEAKAKSIGNEAESKAKGLIGAGQDKVEGLQAEQKASGKGAEVFGALIKDQWVPFLLTKVEPYNHNTKIYHFAFPGEDGESKMAGGEVASALLVKSVAGEDEVKDEKGKPVIRYASPLPSREPCLTFDNLRPYTPISPPDQTGSLTLMIKEYKDGKLTSHMASLTPGKSEMLFKGPIQKYKYQPNTFDKGLCISGGSGITPMYQLISHSLGLSEDKTKWTLIFSNVTEKDILLRKEWDSLAKSHPERLEVKYVLDKAPWGWKGETGYITPQLIGKVFPKTEGEKSLVFVCGPPGQVAAVAGKKDGPRQGEVDGALKELGYTTDEVFKF